MRTALEAFQGSPHRAAFAKLADTPDLDAACEYALLVYTESLPDTYSLDPNQQWAILNKLVGARDVLRLLRVLHKPEEEPKPPVLPKLRPPK